MRNKYESVNVFFMVELTDIVLEDSGWYICHLEKQIFLYFKYGILLIAHEELFY